MRLQQKAVLFLILPTLLVLAIMGVVGFQLVRNALLVQWQETAIAKLQRSAHNIDMRLRRPKDLLLFLQESSSFERNSQTYDLVIDQLRSLDGVVQVKSEWIVETTSGRGKGSMGTMQNGNRKRYHHLEQLSVTSPQYDPEFENETVSQKIYFKDKNDKEIGNIAVHISFRDLIEEVVKSPWWKSNRAYLLDLEGSVLASTQVIEVDSANKRGFAETGSIEGRTLIAMNDESSGTIFDSGLIPNKVSGFYRLSEAPWTMVVIAPGRKVLEPIITLGENFFLVLVLGILIVILIIRIATSKTTHAIKNVSDAAKDLAQGKFGEPLDPKSNDEVGKLTNNFNSMAQQLQERLLLKEAIGVASEVQQNFLPQQGFRSDKLEIEGVVIYCQETGGDYFDLLSYPDNPGKVGVVVGDVVGHGIGAALLMATVRALLRSCAGHFESLSSTIKAVNETICIDTFKTGSFVTLFYLVIHSDSRKISWVRCGHDPAMIFSPTTGQFSELRGDGLVLGIDQSYPYKDYSLIYGEDRQIILIGSDGAWEIKNSVGERFGKERLNHMIASNHELSSKKILALITEEINSYRGEVPHEDDITLTIIKINYE